MSDKIDPQIEPGWKEKLSDEFAADYFTGLKSFLVTEKKNNRVYPPGKEIFRAFDLTPFEQVKVVIIGQDPYHGPGQAEGLCFSVKPGIQIPPSLKNIYKEIHNDIGSPIPEHGSLVSWAEQGVLLLNAVLTVRAHQAGSHRGQGWERFTDAAIVRLSYFRENLVFLLWGSFAQNKGQLIDATKHHILTAPHPSPLSAHRGFLGCKHFSQTNKYLKSHSIGPIDWQIS